MSASAARLSAGDVEDPVAAGSPAVRFVGVLTVCLSLCYHAPFANHAVLSVRDIENGGTIASFQAPTNRVSTVSQENVH